MSAPTHRDVMWVVSSHYRDSSEGNPRPLCVLPHLVTPTSAVLPMCHYTWYQSYCRTLLHTYSCSVPYCHLPDAPNTWYSRGLWRDSQHRDLSYIRSVSKVHNFRKMGLSVNIDWTTISSLVQIFEVVNWPYITKVTVYTLI